jgi:hypothetical protein
MPPSRLRQLHIYWAPQKAKGSGAKCFQKESRTGVVQGKKRSKGEILDDTSGIVIPQVLRRINFTSEFVPI